jgi:zinc protease
MFRLTALLAILMAPLHLMPASAAEISDFKLDNGLEVVVLEDHRAPVVVQMIWYKVGSADEARGQSGIAHFLEHLMFKGTERMEPREFSELVAANGGRDNAFTSFDYTAYFQRVAADRLELMMDLEADRMKNLRIEASEVATERDVVLEERNQRTDSDPGAIFGEQRRAAQYLPHTYGVPIIGWRHEIIGLTQDHAEAFYDLHYSPNNAVLVIAGDVDAAEVKQLAEKYYGVIPANPEIKPRDRIKEPPQLAERRLLYEDERVTQPYVIRTYLAPERDPGAQEEAAALTMLAEVLGGSGATSVLGQKLQFETQKSIYTSAFYSGTALDDTTFGLIMVPSPDVSLREAEDLLDQAVAEFMEEGVDPEQLERIKFQIRASQIYGDDSVQSLARRYGAALTSGLTVDDIEAWPNLLDAVTAEDILEAADKVFDRKQAVTGWMQAPSENEVMQ